MISTHIQCKPKNDNYRKLANYIADANHEGEKSLAHWCAGTWAGDDEYQLSILEVEDTQDLNTRSGKEKTYHLMISFRPEDEAKLTLEDFCDIEIDFAKALGFEEHQRHCGIHKNTDNLHMHIAYNMIHPERLTRHEPFRDFHKRDQVCREIEIKYGLTIDNGRKQNQEPVRENSKAKIVESFSGQESLNSYAKRHKSVIITALENSKNWQEAHQIFLRYGLELKPSANGLTIKDRHGKHHIKPSSIDRSLSKGNLEKRFGLFQAANKNALENFVELEKYEGKPIQKAAERDQLFEQYKFETEQRKKSIDKIKQDEMRLLTPIKNKWINYRKNLEKIPMMRSHKQKLILEAKLNAQAEQAKIKNVFEIKRDEIKAAMPGTSWIKFLQHQANQGQETALAILRSKKEIITPEKDLSAKPDNKNELEKIRQDSRNEQKKILAITGITDKNRKALLTIIKMRQLAEEEKAKGGSSIFNGLKHTIDTKGTVIFHLATGGTIRDNGKELHFSAHDKNAQEVAKKFAQMKWGKAIEIEANLIRLQGKSKNKTQSIGR